MTNPTAREEAKRLIDQCLSEAFDLSQTYSELCYGPRACKTRAALLAFIEGLIADRAHVESLAAAPAAPTLSDERIMELWRTGHSMFHPVVFARAIETEVRALPASPLQGAPVHAAEPLSDERILEIAERWAWGKPVDKDGRVMQFCFDAGGLISVVRALLDTPNAPDMRAICAALGGTGSPRTAP